MGKYIGGYVCVVLILIGVGLWISSSDAQVGGGAGVGGSARPGDNLGDHQATTNLNMHTNSIEGVSNLTVLGTGFFSDGVVGNPSVTIGGSTNGLYEVSAVQLGVSIQGSLIAVFNTNGVATDSLDSRIAGPLTIGGATALAVVIGDAGVTTTNEGSIHVIENVSKEVAGTSFRMAMMGTNANFLLQSGTCTNLEAITFANPFSTVPVVLVTPLNANSITNFVSSLTTNGFTGNLDLTVTSSWLAVGAKAL